MRPLGIIVLISLFPLCLYSQEDQSTLECHNAQPGKPLKLEKNKILFNTITVSDKVDYLFSTDSTEITLFHKSDTKVIDSIKVCYRTKPRFITRSYGHKSLSLVDSTYTEPVDRHPIFEKKVEPQKIFNTGHDLYSGGRISRGITFGNSNDLSVQSMLNLSLEGKLSDDLFISAVITDQNIPFQPEGNTAQLQELDNVFIKIYNNNFGLQAGDLILQNTQNSRFLRYYKSVQGAGLNVNHDLGATSAAVTFAKGKFASVTVQPIDGILGPYRIPGPNGESFVVVWANSERVYLDGKLLKRGFNHDYVIDYNLGELSFNSNIIITEFSRIKVDFEYSANAYSRSILQAGHQYNSDKLDLFVNLYRESDNKNKPIEDISDEEKTLLSLLGDDLDSAIVSGVDSVGFDSDRIRYKKTFRTNVNGNIVEAFEYSTNPDSAVYEVRFSFVGENQGHYRRGINTANGRVYEWSDPESGILTGDYEPYRRLKAPDKREMVNLGGVFKIDQNNELRFESSISSRDKNTFSDLDNDDNNGGALHLGYRLKDLETGISSYRLTSDVSFEYLSTSFSPVDRIREIEFDRDWSYNPSESDSAASDLVVNAEVGLVKDHSNLLRYSIAKRNKGTYVDGFQHRLDFYQKFWRIIIRSDNFLMNNNQLTADEVELKSDWIRTRNEFRVDLTKVVPGYVFSLDQNTVSNKDSIQSSQMYFQEHKMFLTNPESSAHKYMVSYAFRNDYTPINGSIDPYLNTQTFQLSYEKNSKNGKFRSIFTHRNVEDISLQSEENKWRTISGRIDWNQSIFKNIIRSDLTYTISNSRDLRREFVFIQVPTGQGNYTWNDLNEDGIKDLNEFFLAQNLDERNYAKIWVPTNEYVDAFDNTLAYRFNLKFPVKWKNGSSLERIVYRFSNSTSFISSSKTASEKLGEQLFSFITPLNDNELLSSRRNFRTNFFFNRDNPKFGLSSGFKNTAFKNLLSGGQDLFGIKEFDFIVRYRVLKQYVFNLMLLTGSENSFSDLLTDRNFSISNQSIRPKFSWQPKNNLRISITYLLENRIESTSSEDANSSDMNQIETELRFNKENKGYLSGTFSFSSIAFNGIETSPVGIALLKGKRPGSNYDWNLVWQQNLIKGLQLQMGYNGRKNGDSAVIHMGRLQVSALF